ncbi:SRPBCC family protein [Kribbella catacumbae]|uniref:SRPBCC family protein n=1 Tax=Kribbella catacumbae TaxID=460086 RepID=UPI000380A8FB|nr:SRPBCC family protein [Kribbella catacumbae]
MHTNLLVTQTRSISISASPQAVFDLVADPSTLPQWAPGFARAIRPDGDHWIVENDQGEARIIVRTSREHGTVDILSADDPSQGAYSRVLPNGTGSEYQFTLQFPQDAPEDAVTQQLATVDAELEAVRRLCE